MLEINKHILIFRVNLECFIQNYNKEIYLCLSLKYYIFKMRKIKVEISRPECIYMYIYITPANCKLFYSEETSLTHHIDIHTVGKIYCSLRDFLMFFISVFLLLTKFNIFLFYKCFFSNIFKTQYLCFKTIERLNFFFTHLHCITYCKKFYKLFYCRTINIIKVFSCKLWCTAQFYEFCISFIRHVQLGSKNGALISWMTLYKEAAPRTESQKRKTWSTQHTTSARYV